MSTPTSGGDVTRTGTNPEYTEVFGMDGYLPDADVGSFNFYVCKNRFVLLKTKSGPTGGASLGLLGVIVDEGIGRLTKKRHDENLALDEMIRQDSVNRAISYESVVMTKLRDLHWRGRMLEIFYRSLDEKGSEKEVKNLFVPSKKQFERLKHLLPTVLPTDKITIE